MEICIYLTVGCLLLLACDAEGSLLVKGQVLKGIGMAGSISLVGYFVRAVALVLALLGLVVVVVTLTPIDRWWADKLAGGWRHPQGDILIVLGGEESSDDGIIAWDTYVRSLYAVRAFREQGFPVIVTSGSGSPITEAAAMRDFLLSQGVPSSVVRMEDRSRSTRENAQNVAELLKGVSGRKVLLTSDYHIYRALRTFRKAGLEVAPWPVPDAFKHGSSVDERWSGFLDLVLETIKIGYYGVRGWM